jgi:hypothetical protein
MTQPARRTRTTVLALTALVGAAFLLYTLLPPAGASNTGTIKVHDSSEIGDNANDPHVACPFYIEGFGMDAVAGTITIKDWPPTGDKTTVLTSPWVVSDDDQTADHHFLAGPFTLPSGHYKVFVTDTPGHEKMKTYWVDCDGVPTPPPCDDTTLVLTGYHYFVVAGVTYAHLSDVPLSAGDDVTVVFTLLGCGERTLSFAAYDAVADLSDLPAQTVNNADSGDFGNGTHTMDVIVPPCFYQLDFVFGKVIEHFAPDEGVTYHGQQRFIDGTAGGQACTTTSSTSGTTSDTTTSTTTSTESTSTTSTTSTTSETTSTTSETTSTTSGTTTSPTTSTQIPFFPSGTAVVLGLVGALGGALVMLRRRL